MNEKKRPPDTARADRAADDVLPPAPVMASWYSDGELADLDPDIPVIDNRGFWKPFFT